jgi:mRNA-degrading endonuclease toxin of MazEF toxin-antitoxin module
MVNRGEVRWIIGDGTTKVRPGVVMTRQAVAGLLRSVLVAPLTTRHRDIPSEVSLGPEHGLDRSCVANLDNLALVDVDLLGAVITELDASTMSALCAALGAAVGCEEAPSVTRRDLSR